MRPEHFQNDEITLLDVDGELSKTLCRARLLDHFLAHTSAEELSDPPLFESMRMQFAEIFDQLEKISGDLSAARLALREGAQRLPEIAA